MFIREKVDMFIVLIIIIIIIIIIIVSLFELELQYFSSRGEA